ncbi:hypothetical protein HYD_6990 [Candidatus Hydrogenosomobacter endosymbioticus]|uniref:NTP pyrophosphohydrolase MazG putative catalytic core domain-containing protein n=2 Tax=Candidatus Hydrogenosomobacter endosymbioticus TaxID=2558174 RepID=A0ABN6L3U7_9PROT|nr:hypothetical protein HYD_6990 [Candidatus Hydrogenosomobacter endosymbioticus]
MPEIMRARGMVLCERSMDAEEYYKRLKEKLLEEAAEVCSAIDKKEIIIELADLLEVMLAIAKVNDMNLEDIMMAADNKKKENGGFDRRIYNEFVEIESNNQNIEYYKARKDKYPEIDL